MEPSFDITPEHRLQFERAGALRLPGFLPAADVQAMADRLWTDLGRRFGIDRRRRETWTVERPGQYQALQRSGAFRALGSPRLAALADAFLGEGRWVRSGYWGQPLVTFPTGNWDVPHASWHLDFPAPTSPDDLSIIGIFTFLEPARPGGGGTVYVSGSHRVIADYARHAADVEQLRSLDVRALLKQEEPWFADLFTPSDGDRVRRFMVEGGHARGMAVRVEEMTGDPGDMILVHPQVLHAAAANALDTPRMMLTQTLSRQCEIS